MHRPFQWHILEPVSDLVQEDRLITCSQVISGGRNIKVVSSIFPSRPLTWIEERGPGFPRAKNIDFHFDSRTLTRIPAAPRGTVGLFMQDLVQFSAKLLGQVSPEEVQKEKLRVLHCLELAERIRELCQS